MLLLWSSGRSVVRLILLPPAFSHRLPQVFAGNVPYYQYPRDATVVFKVTLGIRPERPHEATSLGLSDIVWSMMEMCWQAEWGKRPRIPFVLQCLKEALRQFIPQPPSQATPAFISTELVGAHVDSDDSSDEGDSAPFRRGMLHSNASL